MQGKYTRILEYYVVPESEEVFKAQRMQASQRDTGTQPERALKGQS